MFEQQAPYVSVKGRTASILIVDDEPHVLSALQSLLSRQYSCKTARSAFEALEYIRQKEFDLVISDITMPNLSGLELLDEISRIRPNLTVILISANLNIQSAIDAIRHGAFDYITKPFSLADVETAVERALLHSSQLQARQQRERYQEEVFTRRSRELGKVESNLSLSLEKLYSNYRATLKALALTLEARDAETEKHCERVVAYCLRIGKELGLADRDLLMLEQGALLHDIGKIGVRDDVLLKPGPLTADEWVEMREHINYGLRIVDKVDFLSGARPVIGQHHEKYDGSGYPFGLRGQEIHINARIFAVADALDAITSDRPYRAAQPYANARAELIANSGTHFDPDVVRAFLNINEEELSQMRRSAQLGDYVERMVDARESGCLSFLLSQQPGRKEISKKVSNDCGDLLDQARNETRRMMSLQLGLEEQAHAIAERSRELRENIRETRSLRRRSDTVFLAR